MKHVKLLKSLREKGWKFEIKGIKHQGFCSYKKKILTLNADWALATIIIHEMIHASDPKLSEKEVLALEAKLAIKISDKEAHELVKLFKQFAREG